ncbi:MAG: Y-family DNA polymerase [Armatimonadota bacterium]
MVTGFRASLAQSIHAQAQAAFCPEAADERTVFLLDYDSYFARCMQQAYPPLRGKPVGIRGPAKGTAIIAASTEAKARGVKVGMHINEARRWCPALEAVAADMNMYGEICTRSLRVLTSYTDKVEPFSIDEAYMDVTDLIEVPDDAPMLAKRLKVDLRAELGAGITCSIGIAPNKMLAKLVSGFHKPDGITHVTRAEVPGLLKEIALTDICGIGPRVERRLQRLGVYTVEQLGRLPREILVREFGVLGHVYWLWGHGIDLAPVSPYHRQPAEKSMGHGLTLPEAVHSRRNFDGVLLRLCERIGRRLRGGRFLGRTVTMYVGYDSEEWRGPMLGFGGHRRLPAHTDDSLQIYDAAQSLMPGPGLERPVRRVNVTVSDLRRGDLQLSLVEDRVKQHNLQQALDAVNDRFGEFTVMRGALLHDTFPLRNGPPGHGLCKRFDVDGKGMQEGAAD